MTIEPWQIATVALAVFAGCSVIVGLILAIRAS